MGIRALLDLRLRKQPNGVFAAAGNGAREYPGRGTPASRRWLLAAAGHGADPGPCGKRVAQSLIAAEANSGPAATAWSVDRDPWALPQ